GDGELAAELVALGLHISFAGMVTYKKSQTLRACAATIPDDRLLIETDAPYLAPEPVRSRRPNEPALVRHTAECLAQVRGVSLDQLAALTTANAKRLFAV
ncbi:MAG: hydrolase TatD, partial [Planctomycetota bacterium]